MAKLTLTDIGSRYGSIDALNANFTAIELAMENTLSLDGSVPNGLLAPLDANSQRIINLPTPVGASDAATKTYVDGVTAAILTYVADIVIVSANIASVQTVAGISANVTTVAGIATNVTAVGGIAANVTTVAGISSDVTAVVADAVDIGLVASSIANVNTTAANIANVNTVASNTTNINAVAADAVDIGTVASNITNVNTVAGVSPAVSTNATNIASINTNATNIVAIQTASANAASALASKDAAAISETNAAASYDSFDDRYLGSKAVAPTLDNDGAALLTGALYFDTIINRLRVYDGAAWQTTVTTAAGVSSVNLITGDVTLKTINSAALTGVGDIVLATGGGSATGTNTGDQTAATVANAPAGNIAATTVQAAINELNDEKVSRDNPSYLSQTLTDAVNIVWNANLGSVASVTIVANRTQDLPTNLKVGNYILVINQDATGSRLITWAAGFRWSGGAAPVLSTAASARDVLSFFCDGSVMYGNLAIRGAA